MRQRRLSLWGIGMLIAGAGMVMLINSSTAQAQLAHHPATQTQPTKGSTQVLCVGAFDQLTAESAGHKTWRLLG